MKFYNDPYAASFTDEEAKEFKYKIDVGRIGGDTRWFTIIEWLNVEVGAKNWAVEMTGLLGSKPKPVAVYYCFRNEPDMIYFKLRWWL